MQHRGRASRSARGERRHDCHLPTGREPPAAVQALVMGAFVDLTGRAFGRFAVQKRAINSRWRETRWECLCQCGHSSIVRAKHLLSGRSRSCGCLKRELAVALHRVHGRTKTPVYRSWQMMLNRCYNERGKDYRRYGGRGITVCDRWRFGNGVHSGFECFLADMGERPPATSIDRYPDNDGNYEPRNCRWATQSQQCFNKSHPRRARKRDAGMRLAKEAVG